MKRNFSLLLAIILVVVQTLGVWHMAEHAFCKHAHDGKTCEISLAFEQAKSTGTSYKPLPIPTAFFVIKETPVLPALHEFSINSEANPRAPPYIHSA